jgi:site-specific DNA-adenine methylase
MIIIPNTGSYYGGKNGSGVYQAIINQIPPHKVYIEPFLGKGAIMRYKKPAPVYNIGCELDEDLINSFWNPAIKEQGLNIIVNHKNGIDFLHDVGHGETFIQYGKEVFVYCDPPYLIESRKTPRARYKHEFLRADHIEFLDVVTRLPFNVAISCYNNDLYSDQLKGWRKIEFKAQTRQGSATEVLYMNYPEPEQLHDYSYLGKTFRERERIRKKLQRHVQGLKRLPIFERKAIIEAIVNI